MPVNNLLMAIDMHHLANAVCHALMHSLWLGLVAALLAGIVIACTTRSQPAVRYYLLLGICGLFVSACLAFFLLQYSAPQELDKTLVTAATPEAGLILVTGPASPLTPVNAWQKLVQLTDKYAGIIAGCWLFIVFWKSARLVVGLNRLQQCRVQSTITPAEEWLTRVQALAAQVNIRKMVQVFESARVKVPCTIGYLKPVILVPLGMFAMLPPSQVESILLHELAHIKRKDFAINIILECVEAVFFFNPAMLWLLHVIRQEREVCCDAIVTASNDKPTQYMEALVSFQEIFGRQAYMMPLTGRNSLLFYRIKRMISKKNKNLTFMEKLFLSLSVVAVVSLSFMPAGSKTINSKKPAQVYRIAKPVNTIAIANPQTQISLPAPAPQIKKQVAAVAVPGQAVNELPQDSIIGVHRYTIASPLKRTDYIEIKVASGTVYKIAKEKGSITGFSINGVDRDVKEAGNYIDMINSAETRADAAENGRHKMEQQRLQAEQRRKETETKAATIEKHRHAMEQQRLQAEQGRKEMETRAVTLNNERHMRQQHRLQAEQKRKEAELKRREHRLNHQQFFKIQDSLSAIHKQKVRDILQYIVKSGIAKDAGSVESFALTNTAFVVNGKTQDAAIHQQLAKTYGVHSDFGLYFGSVPGTAKGYIFGRREIEITQ